MAKTILVAEDSLMLRKVALLSQNEIDALLSALSPVAEEAPAAPAAGAAAFLSPPPPQAASIMVLRARTTARTRLDFLICFHTPFSYFILLY